MTRNEIILGLVALVLVVFSLVVALVVPRRNPRFPGRYLRPFVAVSVLLVAGMLTAVEVLGAEHETEAEHAGEATHEETTVAETGTTTGETGTETASTATGGETAGDAAAGRELFTSGAQPPCASCHTLEAAGATQTLGPNLDEALPGKDAAFIHESIVDPNAQIASGFSAGLMPTTYGEQLSDQQIADLVAFLVESTKG